MHLELNIKYTCIYIDGGGTVYDGGIWVKKETPKTITFTCIEESFFAVNWNELIIYKDKKKSNRHCLSDFEDGAYTIYPDQCGTPHIFEPIK